MALGTPSVAMVAMVNICRSIDFVSIQYKPLQDNSLTCESDRMLYHRTSTSQGSLSKASDSPSLDKHYDACDHPRALYTSQSLLALNSIKNLINRRAMEYRTNPPRPEDGFYNLRITQYPKPKQNSSPSINPHPCILHPSFPSGLESLISVETFHGWRLQELILSGTSLNAAMVDAIAG
jgi:hypothetical protein